MPFLTWGTHHLKKKKGKKRKSPKFKVQNFGQIMPTEVNLSSKTQMTTSKLQLLIAIMPVKIPQFCFPPQIMPVLIRPRGTQQIFAISQFLLSGIEFSLTKGSFTCHFAICLEKFIRVNQMAKTPNIGDRWPKELQLRSDPSLDGGSNKWCRGHEKFQIFQPADTCVFHLDQVTI